MKPTLTYWDSNPNTGRTEAFTIAGETFAREAGISFEYRPVGIKGYVDKVLEAWGRGEGPDVIDVWPAWIPRLKAGLLPLEDAFSEWPARDRYDRSHLDLSRSVDDTLWFLACDLFIQGTHYRNDLMRAAGLEDPRTLDEAGNWTLDAFRETAARLHDPEAGVVGVSLRGGQGGELTALNLMVSANQGNLHDSGGRCLLDTPEAIKALQAYVALAHPLGLAQPTAATDGYLEFAWRFYERGAAMMLHNDDAAKSAQNRYLGHDAYRNCRLPSTTGDPWVGLAGFGVGANRQSPLADHAARYVHFFVEHYGRHLNLGTQASGESRIQSHDCRPMHPWPPEPDPLMLPFRRILEERNRLYRLPWEDPRFSRAIAETIQPGLSGLLRGDGNPAEAARAWAEALHQTT
jgi:ABC-type glycerol-3-phosphate transport system substrate-binding protein